MSELVAVGLDATRAEVAERERWVLTEAERSALYAAARAQGAGLVFLATCRRFEVYAEGASAETVIDWLRTVRPASDLSAFDLSTFVVRRGDEAAAHLLRTAAGLCSAVLGEVQILGQVRRARGAAQRARTLTPVLAATFAQAVATGRRVRAETGLGRGAASVASAAVQRADALAGGLAGRHVVVVGAGAMGRLVVRLLPGERPARVTLVSAHAPVGLGVDVAPPSRVATLLSTADVVFGATTKRVLDVEMLHTIQAARGHRPLALIDLGMPRTVAPEAACVPGVTLCDVDALGDAVEAQRALRETAIPAAEALVREGLETLRATHQRLHHDAVVRDLRRKAEQIRREALARHGASDDPAAAALSQTLTTWLLHDLTNALRSDDARRLDPALLRTLLHVQPVVG